MTKRKPTDTEALEQAESDAAAEAAAIAPPAAAVGSDASAEADAALEAAAIAQAAGDDDAAGPSSADYSTAFSPRNVAVGLAIVAGLVAFAASRHRRKRDAGRGDR